MQWITLDEEPVAVTAPGGIVYSTDPKVVGARDGLMYYLKGPDTQTLVAEAVAYQLAAEVGLEVPDCAFCHNPADDNRIYFASRAARYRSGLDQLLQRRELIMNPGILPTVLAFDVWISNRDRNMGAIVAEPIGGRDSAQVKLLAIDFEKSDVLRGVDRFTITAKYRPQHCRPMNELGRYFDGIPFPTDTCRRISAVTEDAITSVFQHVAFDLAGHSVTWIESASNFLSHRARHINELAREACA